MTHSFLPDPIRAKQLDQEKHSDLADSLRHLSGASADALPDIGTLLAPVIQHIDAGGRVSAATFGAYFDLADALINENLDAAHQAAKGLSQGFSRTKGVSVLYRGTDDAAFLDRSFDRRMGEDAQTFAPLDPADAADFPDLIQDGLALLTAGYPELSGEVQAIVHEVLLAQAPKDAKFEFDGASHFQFWGLLVLNPKHHRNRLALAEVLAHEAGHSLLFGFMRDQTLVNNPDDELYASPLRVDLRPMDGIFHATFVSARMALAMETLANSGVLTSQEVQQAREAAQGDRNNFDKGIGVVREHGDLTDLGQALITQAEDWIRGTA